MRHVTLTGRRSLLLQESQTLFVWRLRRELRRAPRFTLDPSGTDWDRHYSLCRADEPGFAQQINAGAATAGKTGPNAAMNRQLAHAERARCMTTCY
ncbi:hypothetical protein KCP77_18940 [Salmonella enterica subsp. enterica]|nr:hypothetical protein KCP77_18940 [Salmonella enterica subsp. enterica]